MIKVIKFGIIEIGNWIFFGCLNYFGVVSMFWFGERLVVIIVLKYFQVVIVVLVNVRKYKIWMKCVDVKYCD